MAEEASPDRLDIDLAYRQDEPGEMEREEEEQKDTDVKEVVLVTVAETSSPQLVTPPGDDVAILQGSPKDKTLIESEPKLSSPLQHVLPSPPDVADAAHSISIDSPRDDSNLFPLRPLTKEFSILSSVSTISQEKGTGHSSSAFSLPDDKYNADKGGAVSAEDDAPERDVVSVAFGPKGAWFISWSDGVVCWECLPPTLHAKLQGRHKGLPGIRSISISENSHWFVVYNDGSHANSGFPIEGKLREALYGDHADAEILSFTFAVGGGWIVTRVDGTFDHERVPSTLGDLLRKRTNLDPKIINVSISSFGGWFVQFEDGECEWEALPPSLDRLLVQFIRKGDNSMVLSLSPSDGQSYFIALNATLEFVHESDKFRQTLEWGNSTPALDRSRNSPTAKAVLGEGQFVPPCEYYFQSIFRASELVEVAMERLEL